MFDRKVFSLLNSPAHLLSLGSTSQCPWLSQTTVSIWRGDEEDQYEDHQCEQTRTPLQKKSQDVPVTIEAPGGWEGSQLQNPPVSWSGKTFLIMLSFFADVYFFSLTYLWQCRTRDQDRRNEILSLGVVVSVNKNEIWEESFVQEVLLLALPSAEFKISFWAIAASCCSRKFFI